MLLCEYMKVYKGMSVCENICVRVHMCEFVGGIGV